MSSSSVHATGGSQLSAATLVMAFIAGFLAVPVFHQILFLIFYLAGILPIAPYSMAPTQPFGVPSTGRALAGDGVALGVVGFVDLRTAGHTQVQHRCRVSGG